METMRLVFRGIIDGSMTVQSSLIQFIAYKKLESLSAQDREGLSLRASS